VFVVALVISEELLGESDDIDSATEQANMLFQNEVDVQVRPLSEGIPC
jgi:hypothetical protein